MTPAPLRAATSEPSDASSSDPAAAARPCASVPSAAPVPASNRTTDGVPVIIMTYKDESLPKTRSTGPASPEAAETNVSMNAPVWPL